jgi:hypothetical protein
VKVADHRQSTASALATTVSVSPDSGIQHQGTVSSVVRWSVLVERAQVATMRGIRPAHLLQNYYRFDVIRVGSDPAIVFIIHIISVVLLVLMSPRHTNRKTSSATG